jgi:hypothetical protein
MSDWHYSSCDWFYFFLFILSFLPDERRTIPARFLALSDSEEFMAAPLTFPS